MHVHATRNEDSVDPFEELAEGVLVIVEQRHEARHRSHERDRHVIALVHHHGQRQSGGDAVDGLQRLGGDGDQRAVASHTVQGSGTT